MYLYYLGISVDNQEVRELCPRQIARKEWRKLTLQNYNNKKDRAQGMVWTEVKRGQDIGLWGHRQ